MLIALLVSVLASLAGAATSPTTALASPTPQNSQRPSRTAQQPTDPSVQVTLTGVTPASVTAKGTITITGTVRNTSKVPMTWVQVSFWRSRDPITDPAALDSVLASPVTVPIGERWFNEKNEASIDNVTDPEATRTFEPGQQASFTVSGTASQMGLTSPGSYLVGVHVQATPQGQDRLTVGRSRVLTVVSDATTKARLTPVVELASRPSVGLDGTFMDDHLAGELPGRLGSLVAAATNRHTTVLIDPALLDEVTAMAAGYTVNGKPGTGTQAAKQWLAGLAPLLSSGRAYRLPYGNADVVGAAREDRGVVLSRSRTALSPDNPASSLPLAVVDEAGALDRPALSLIVSQLHPQMVLSAAADPSRGSYSDAGTMLMPLTAGLTDGGPDQAAGPAQRRGRLLAQTALDSQAGRPVVTVVDTGAELDAAGLTATSKPEPWLTVTDLWTAIGTPSTSNPLPSSSKVPTVLSGSWWADQTAAARDAADWANVLDDPATTLKTARTLSRGVSLNLRDSERQNWLAQAMSSATQLLSGQSILLHAAESFVMSSSSNTLPLTVTNHLAETVRIKVKFTSEYPQRITIPTTSVVTIRSGETQTVRFSPRASSNGVVGMTAQLTGPGGRPLGSPRSFLVRATRMDDIGWIIIVVSGAVVLGATLLRIHQVRSRQGTAASTFTKELTEGLEEASQHHADRPEEQPAGKPADSPSDPPSVPQATDDAGRGSRSDR
jgi:hypothetical protein